MGAFAARRGAHRGEAGGDVIPAAGNAAGEEAPAPW
eukprot:gene13397-4976_t